MNTPIFGPFDVGRSTNLAANSITNLYPELVETKDGKAVGALYGCPGLDLLATVGTGPIRGTQVMAGALYVVSGSALYSVDTSFTVSASLGAIAAGAVSMENNGTQLAVFAGANGYTYSVSGGYAAIVLPYATVGVPIRATQQDGYGLINQPGTNLMFQSGLLDMTSWPALTFGSATGDPDNLLALAQVDRELWLLKENETEIWYNAGTTGLTFARLDGAYIETGIAAISSLARSGSTLLWLEQRKTGQGVVVQSRGHATFRISTNAVEDAIRQYSVISDATGYTYQQDGHEFYVLNFPTGDATWVYDITVSNEMNVPAWHQRGAWDGAAFHRHWADNHSLFAGKNVVGDYRNGNLYAFNIATLTDNGTARRWLRSWRALPKPSEQPVRFSRLRVDMQTGVGVVTGAPQANLRWSDDGAHTWSPTMTASVGPTGATAQRVMFTAMGATKRTSGLDRVFELSSTDQFPVAIIGADLEAA